MNQEHVDALVRELDVIEGLIEEQLEQRYEILARLQALLPPGGDIVWQ